MTNITIPPAALEAGAREQARRDNVDWDNLYDIAKESRIEDTRAACLAMLEAWPGMKHDQMAHEAEPKAIILPLPPQENPDAEA